MTDHFAEAESYLKRLDTLTATDAYVAVIAAQAHATLAQGQAAAEMVAMQKTLLATMTPQSDGTGALPTSPSPEVGVATSAPVPSPEEPTEFGSAIWAVKGDVPARWIRSNSGYWFSEWSLRADWDELSGVEVLRIGVGADNTDAYRLAREDAAREIRARIQALRDAAITAPEQAQLDKAIKACR